MSNDAGVNATLAASASPLTRVSFPPEAKLVPARIVLPNVRKLFIPDPGYTMFEADLAGADAQVVAAEAEDKDLRAAFRAQLDIHSFNAEALWGAKFSSLSKESFERYKLRQSCKHAVHGTNYGGRPPAIARHPAINWTVHEADQFQKRWFSLHPNIASWHKRVQRELDTSRTIRNKFGYRRVFFDRPDESFTEALAWVPQSTVALTTYLGAFALETAIPQVEILLQVHDSLVFQLPNSTSWSYKQIRTALKVVIPYPDSLTIPWGLASSEVSWGDCNKVEETK